MYIFLNQFHLNLCMVMELCTWLCLRPNVDGSWMVIMASSRRIRNTQFLMQCVCWCNCRSKVPTHMTNNDDMLFTCYSHFIHKFFVDYILNWVPCICNWINCQIHEIGLENHYNLLYWTPIFRCTSQCVYFIIDVKTTFKLRWDWTMCSNFNILLYVLEL
jgi:hypothetical protein